MNDRVGCDIRFEEVDLYSLVGIERQAAIGAMTNGQELPFVLIAGEVVCAGCLDVSLIAEALS